MFIKPFKTKSNVQLRGSDLKKFRLRVEQSFPDINEIDLQNLLPLKSTLNQIKIITHSNIACTVYAIEKRPLFFEDANGNLIPTVYALWITPDILPYFTTYTAVLPKLANGADLMLPGVIRKESGMYAYGRFKKDQLVAVNLTSNKSAIGVGRLARSSDDLYLSAGHGVCVKMLHVFGDKLWDLEPSVTMQIPEAKAVLEIPKDEDFPELGALIKNQKRSVHEEKNDKVTLEITEQSEIESKPIDDDEKTLIVESEDNNIKELIQNENDDCIDQKSEDNMDTILKNAFIKALKFDGKNLTLPLLTSNFYRLHVIPAASKQIDLKQTTYKKISKFLNEMSKQGFITLCEEAKGIEKITSINLEHSEIQNFIPTDDANTGNKNKETQLFHAQMTELYIITNETLPLFAKMNYKRGDGLPANQIKKLLKEYVSKNRLQSIQNTKIIKLDQILMDICETEELNLDEIYHCVLDKMHYTFEMRDSNCGSSGGKNNKPPIQMSLATRSGNKKVTLVSNLEAYGIIISEFSKSCKIGAAASTSMVKTANQKQEQLQIQGNQIRFIYNLLTETYKIPPKQISGLDLAKKEKKKKK